MEPGEVDPQVGDFQQVLHLVTVRVGRSEPRRQSVEDDLREGRAKSHTPVTVQSGYERLIIDQSRQKLLTKRTIIT